MSAAAPLLTISTDGTASVPSVRDGVTTDQARLEALMRLRQQLGDGPDTQIATRLPLPVALGSEAADHLLPASLALLDGVSGDLTSFGWRLGPGRSAAWHRAADLRAESADAARIAWLGYEGTVQLTTLGPLTLAAATWTASGERSLTDPGLMRDLPALLAAGVSAFLQRLREHLPQARLHLMVLEPAADAIVGGHLRPASGRGTLPGIPAPELGPRWSALLAELATTLTPGVLGAPATVEPRDGSAHPSLASDHLTLHVGYREELLSAARQAGAHRIAVSPRRLGALQTAPSRAAWEQLADLADHGIAVDALLAPSRASADLDHLLRMTAELGLAPRELAGYTLVGSRIPALVGRPEKGALSGAEDPAQEAALAPHLTGSDIDALRRASVAFAERITAKNTGNAPVDAPQWDGDPAAAAPRIRRSRRPGAHR